MILSEVYCQNYCLLKQEKTYKNHINWRFETSSPIYGSPISDGENVYFGSNDSCFYAISTFTGKIKWKFKTNGQIRSTPYLIDHQIYFISGDGFLYCLNKIGNLEWKFNAGPEVKYDFADYHQSSILISNNTIYFGSGNNILYSIDVSTKRINWTFKANDVIHSNVICKDGKIFFGSFDGNVYAIDSNNGELLWKFKTVGHKYFPKGEVQGRLSISNEFIIVGARDYNVYAIDIEKGYCHWNKNFSKGWVLSNTVRDSLLYMAGADERILTCTNLKTGQDIWKKNMEFLMFGEPVFENDILYIGTTIGKLHKINSLTGETIWSFNTKGYEKNHLKYFKVDDTYRDDIYAIIKSDEHFLEVENELGGIFSKALISGDNIIFTSTEGVIYSIKK